MTKIPISFPQGTPRANGTSSNWWSFSLSPSSRAGENGDNFPGHQGHLCVTISWDKFKGIERCRSEALGGRGWEYTLNNEYMSSI